MDNKIKQSLASRLNKSSPRFEINTTGLEYTNLKEVHNTYGDGVTFRIHAIYINTKGHFGDAPVFVTDGAIINMPSHATEEVRELLNLPEAIDAIKAGLLGFSTYTYQSKNPTLKGQTFYGFNYEDLGEDEQTNLIELEHIKR